MQIEKYTIYDMPSIVSLVASARVVIYDNNNDLTTISELQLKMAKEIFINAIGMDIEYEAIPVFEKISSVNELFLETIIYIQKIKNHIIQNQNGIKKLVDNRFEIYFDISKKEGIFNIVECALSFINEVMNEDKNIFFKEEYNTLIRSTNFSLSDFFKFDKTQAAFHLGIPSILETGSRLFIGHGEYSKLIATGYLSNTSVLGKNIAADKDRSSSFMTKQKLPAPMQIYANTSSSAVSAANKIGYPVVVKPRSGNKGRAVSVNLKNDSEVIQAYDFSYKEMESSSVVVEKFLEGDDHRILVIDYKVVGVVKRLPAHVIGDGVHTVEELIDIVNISQRRDGLKLLPIKIDYEVLRLLTKQNFTPDSIVPKNKYVVLRGASNVSLGGTTIDLTDEIHPDNIAMAEESAKTLMLNVAGVDFVTTDISKSYKDGYGGVVEINAGPGVDLHMYPTNGLARNISWAMTRTEFKSDEISSIPLIMVVGKKRRANSVKKLTSVMNFIGYNTSLYGQNYTQNDSDTYYGTSRESLNSILTNKIINCVVIETSSADILKKGLPLRKSTVTVISDDLISNNLKKMSYDETIENRIIKLCVESSSELILLDGDSLSFKKVLEYTPKSKTMSIFTSVNDNNSLSIKEYIENDGRAMFIDNDNGSYNIMYEDKNEKMILTSLCMDSYNKYKNELREVMFSFAVICHFGGSKQLIKNYLKHIINIGFVPSSLSHKMLTNKHFVVADINDAEALNNICDMSSLANKIYLIYNEKVDIKHLTSILTHKDIIQITGNENRLFDNWKFLNNVANENSFIIYLSSNKVSRKNYMDEIYKNEKFIMINNIFHSDTINKLFKSNFSERVKFEVNYISLNIHTKGKNDLVVIPNMYDVEKNYLTQELIINAVNDGAKAIVCSFYPTVLARFHNIVVSDNISLGLKYMAYQKAKSSSGIDKSLLITMNDSELISFINY